MEKQEGQLTYRRHWTGLLIPTFITILMLATIIASGIFLFMFEIVSFEEHLPYIILYAGVFVFLIISYFFALWTFWYLDAWIVTKDRLIDSQLVSFFVHRRSEIPLKQVQDISFRITGTLATFFRFGNINIQTASKQGSFKLMSIQDPAKAVENISALVKKAMAPRRNGPPRHLNHSIGMPLGEILVKAGLLSASDLNTALSEQINTSKLLGEILLNKGLITGEDLSSALGSQQQEPQQKTHISEIDLSHYQIDPLIIQNINQDMAMQYVAIPISRTHEGGILVAIADPSDINMDKIRSQVQVSVDFVTADRNQILEAIQKHYNLGSQQ